MNRIAYVGNDGNLFTINPDGTDISQLTNTDLRVGPAGPVLAQTAQTQLFYAWPTWSPDSSKIAASLVAVSGNDVRLSVEVIDVADGGSTRVYTNQPNTASIARGAPHYLYWAPDSAKITFLAAEPTVLTLFSARSLTVLHSGVGMCCQGALCTSPTARQRRYSGLSSKR